MTKRSTRTKRDMTTIWVTRETSRQIDRIRLDFNRNEPKADFIAEAVDCLANSLKAATAPTDPNQ